MDEMKTNNQSRYACPQNKQELDMLEIHKIKGLDGIIRIEQAALYDQWGVDEGEKMVLFHEAVKRWCNRPI